MEGGHYIVRSEPLSYAESEKQVPAYVRPGSLRTIIAVVFSVLKGDMSRVKEMEDVAAVQAKLRNEPAPPMKPLDPKELEGLDDGDKVLKILEHRDFQNRGSSAWGAKIIDKIESNASRRGKAKYAAVHSILGSVVGLSSAAKRYLKFVVSLLWPSGEWDDNPEDIVDALTEAEARARLGSSRRAVSAVATVPGGGRSGKQKKTKATPRRRRRSKSRRSGRRSRSRSRGLLK